MGTECTRNILTGSSVAPLLRSWYSVYIPYPLAVGGRILVISYVCIGWEGNILRLAFRGSWFRDVVCIAWRETEDTFKSSRELHVDLANILAAEVCTGHRDFREPQLRTG